MVPPVVGLVKLTGVLLAPLHNTWFGTGVTVAVGLTVMVKLRGVPTQLTPALVYVGVTVIVAVTGALVILDPVNEGISPVPLATRPIDISLLVQLYAMVPPVVGLVKMIVAVAVLLHITWLATGFTVAVGLTVTSTVNAVPAQVTPALV